MRKKMMKLSGIVLLLVLVIAPSIFFYMKYREANTLLNNPTEASKKEVKEVVSQLSMIMELPKDEDPTIATVLDKEKLKDQPFFKNAEKGDKVVIYSKAQKAILYRPSTNKVIEVAPINLGAGATPTGTQTAELKVVLYNGTTTAGLTTTLETALKKDVAGLTVVAKEQAKATTYAKTLVVDLSGNKAKEAKQLADYLGGDVGTLPAGEVKPTNAEMLIIVGKNYGAATPSAAPSVVPSVTTAPEAE